MMGIKGYFFVVREFEALKNHGKEFTAFDESTFLTILLGLQSHFSFDLWCFVGVLDHLS